MTLNSNYTTITYEGDGHTKKFAVPFKFFDDEIAIYINKSFATYEKGQDYTITGSGEETGGEVTFAVAPAVNSKLTICRDVKLHQLVKFIEGENFPASDYEYSLDRIYMVLQELKQKVANCMSFPLGEESWETFTQSLLKIKANEETNWQASTIYNMGDLSYDTGCWWLCLENNNIGKKPQDNENVWLKIAIADTYTKTEIENKIDEAISAHVIVTHNTTVLPTSWTESDDVAGYNYKANISVSGITRQMSGFVTFTPSDAVSGNLAPMCAIYDGGYSIYAKEEPSENVTILNAFFVGE